MNYELWIVWSANLFWFVLFCADKGFRCSKEEEVNGHVVICLLVSRCFLPQMRKGLFLRSFILSVESREDHFFCAPGRI
jgi:hypothetical protein